MATGFGTNQYAVYHAVYRFLGRQGCMERVCPYPAAKQLDVAVKCKKQAITIV